MIIVILSLKASLSLSSFCLFNKSSTLIDDMICLMVKLKQIYAWDTNSNFLLVKLICVSCASIITQFSSNVGHV